MLDGMKSLMNPKSSVKRPIEVADIVSEAKRLKCSALKLPNEMWMKILSYLKNKDIFGNFALVSKHFRALTLDPSTVKFLSVEDNSIKAKSMSRYKKWMKVIKRSRSLVELEIINNYDKLQWNDLILEALKSNPYLKTLKTYNYGNKSEFSHGIIEALKLARNLQHFQTGNVMLNQDVLDEICKLKTLKTLDVYGSDDIISPQFIENLALSNNPIEFFYSSSILGDELAKINAWHILFEKKKHTIKKVCGLRFNRAYF